MTLGWKDVLKPSWRQRSRLSLLEKTLHQRGGDVGPAWSQVYLLVLSVFFYSVCNRLFPPLLVLFELLRASTVPLNLETWLTRVA